MNRDDVEHVLRDAGFTILALSSEPSIVIGERPIPGHPIHARRCVVTGFDHDWTAALYWRRPGAWPAWTEWEHTELHRRSCIASPEHLGLFVGGACSVPVDDAEVLAIMRASEVEPRQGIERVA